MLEIRDIYKTFNPGTINEKRALRGVSLTLEDGDFVKIDNITLGYTFRFKNPKNPIRTLRLYASGLNLYTFTRYQGVDPEINFNGLTPGVDYVAGYPTTRTFTFGVKLGF